MIAAASLPWFARHEARLAWRDWLAMMQGGRRGRARRAGIALAIFVGFLHGLAYGVLSPYAANIAADKQTLFALTGAGFLVWALMLSQAMESVTRVFYARADLDLILSSPASAGAVFAVRMGAIALTTTIMAMLLIGPFANMLAYLAGARFLAIYGALAAMGMSAAALAILISGALFRLVGARRTRLIAQIVAAIVGAGFVIGVQAIAVVSWGDISRFALFRSAEWAAAAPALDSLAWTPARAAMGDVAALTALIGMAGLLLVAVIASHAGGFARIALATAGAPRGATGRSALRRGFLPRSAAQTLRRKEWMLLARDPWLLSQTLMQILYLVPPALLLWRNFGGDSGGFVILAPVLTMASGQLAGGLAWLAISGEDAPDLVATAPIEPALAMRAKIEAVMAAVALPLAPLVAGVALVSPLTALVTVAGAALAAAAATAIQIFFKAQAKRSHFRRRHTSSRVATFAEAFSSISIAAAAGLTAAGSWFALAPILFALLVVIVARSAAGKPAA